MNPEILNNPVESQEKVSQEAALLADIWAKSQCDSDPGLCLSLAQELQDV
jgi:hypothetical protein